MSTLVVLTYVECIERFRANQIARRFLSGTLTLEQNEVSDFHCAYFPGWHGVLWNLATDTHFILASLVIGPV